MVLARSEDIAIEVGGRTGTVRRPTIVGALIAKAAAHTVGDGKDRHRNDFAMLASMLTASDLRDANVSKRERKYLTAMLAAVVDDPIATEVSPDARNGLERRSRIL